MSKIKADPNAVAITLILEASKIEQLRTILNYSRLLESKNLLNKSEAVNFAIEELMKNLKEKLQPTSN